MKKTPRLTKKILHDEDALGLAIDAVLLRSNRFRRASRCVRKLQRKLRRMITRDAWLTYLRLEEVVNERAAIEADVLVEWAFKSGRRP
jgi:hypothetical protein